MKKILMLILFVSLVVGCRGQEKQRHLTNPETFNKIENIANEGIKKHNLPSIAVGIVKNGEIIYAKGIGFADRDKKITADENTIYQIGSVTKTFTGNILAQLIAEKKISLDEPLTKFFPKTLKFPKDKNNRAISVKDIATHSAGFPRYPANLVRTDGDPILGFSRQELYKGIELVKIRTSAGEKYSYSNFGYGILGTALENLTNKTLSELFENRVFAPLEMKNSSLDLTEKIKSKLATPYRDDDPFKRTEPWEMGAMAGAGNVFSSVNDLSSFMIEMLKENKINKIQQKEYLKINETWSYGLGCFLIKSKSKNTTMIHHGGDIDGYASYLILYPEFNAGLVILTNSGMGQEFGETAEEIHKLAFSELFNENKND